MENRETILQELRQISEAVANLPKGNVYAVPAGYFDGLAASIIGRIQIENSEFGVKAAPFKVPLGYFDGLADNILNKIKQQDVSVAEELNSLAPLLNTISKQPVYTVPDGYFESLEITVPLKLTKPAAKIFGLGKTKRIIQYAVAACTLGILMVGAYMYTHKSSTQIADKNAVAAIPYDSAVNMDINNELASVNEQEIDNYLQESPTGSFTINTSITDDEDIDVQQVIKSASDDEINEYLKENAAPAEKSAGG